MWVATVIFAGLLASSCTDRIDEDGFRIIEPVDDPHILPWFFDILAREPIMGNGGHARVGRYRMVTECGDGGLAHYIMTDSWRESDSLSALVMYGDRARSRALGHFNIDTPCFDDDWTFDYDQDGICDVAVVYSNRVTLFLEVFNHMAGRCLKTALVNGTDRDGDGYWDGRGQFVDEYDVNGDGCPELLVAVDVGYDLYPRQLMCVDLVGGSVLWTYSYAGIVSHLISGVVSLVPDSTPAILLGIASKGNAAVSGEMDDQHSYVVVLGMDGRPRWWRETGDTFTRSDPVTADYERDGRLEVVVQKVIDSTIGDSTVAMTELQVLDGLSGELLHSLKLGAVGRVQDFRRIDLDQDGTQELMLGLSVGQILILDQQMNILRRAKLPGRPSFVAARDILGNGRHQLLITSSDGHLWLLDEKLSVLAQFACPEQPFPAWCDIEPGGNVPRRVILAADHGRVYYILGLTEIPFSRVFTRYPGLAFWTAFIPMALIVVMLWYMWSRLRRKNRLISIQHDELNSAIEKLRLAQAKLIAVEELQKAQSALTASEQRFHELADMMPQVLFELDLEGNVTYSNRQGFVCFGYEPEDLGKGLRNVDLFIPEDLERLKRNHQRALQGGDYLQKEYIALRKDGTTFPALTYVRPIVREGEVVGLRGILLDISEIKRAASTVRDTEKKYQALIEATDTGFLILDEQGRVIDANEEYVRLTGRDRLEQILGRPVTDWTADHDRERNAVEVRKCQERGSTRNLEIDYVWPDGRVLPIDVNAEVVSTAEGTRILALCRDITERRQASEALRMSEERYRGLVEGAGEAIFLMNREGEYQYMNQIAAERLSGKPDDFVGCNIRELFPKEVAAQHLKMILRVFDSGERSVSESITELQGERRSYNTSLQPILGADGSIVSVLGIARDITSFVEAQQDLNHQRDFVSNLLETAHSLIICLDHEGRITVFNRACEKLTGYAGQEVMGEIYVDLFLPKDDPFLHSDRDFAAWAEDNVSNTFEAPLVTKTGEVRTILWSNSSQYDAHTDRWSSISVGQDVTERKRAEMALVKSEEKYRLLVENIEADIVVIDYDGVFLFVSQRSAKSFGLPVEEIVGRKNTGFFPREEADRQMANIRGVIDTGVEWAEETEVVFGGRVRWFKINILLHHHYPSESPAALIISRDMTETHRTARALEESEEKWRNLVMNLTDNIMSVDREGTILAVNWTMPGWTKEQVIGLKATECVAEEYREETMKVLEEVFETGEPQTIELLGDGPNGPYSAYYITRIVRSSSDPNRATLISTDITERRKAQDALRQSEERIRTLLNATTETMILLDTKGIILALNRTAAERWGYTDDDIDSLVGKSAIDLAVTDWDEEVSEARLKHFRAAIETGQASRLVDERNGMIFDTHYYPFRGDDGEVVCLAIFGTDITEARQADEELQRAAEERYEQVRRIAGGVAHEIYNALFPAVAGLAKLSERLDLDAPEELERNRTLLELASKSVTRAVDTTDLVKVFTRLEEEREVNEISLRSILDEITAAHADRLEVLGVEVAVEVASEDFIRMNRQHAYSVFNNLMSNSLDALADVAHERRITITSRRDNGRLRVEFIDNGPGIAEENLSRVFQAFYSTKPTTGTGLGLAMVKRIIELYGGKVRVQSTIDKSTIFVILFKLDNIDQTARN